MTDRKSIDTQASPPLVTKTLRSSAEVQAWLEEQRRKASYMDEHAKPWQKAAKAADFYFQRYEHPTGEQLDIFGVILEPQGEDIEIMARVPFRRLVRAWSKDCPEGEIGTLHVGAIWEILSRERFELIRMAGWTLPVDLAAKFAGLRPRKV